MIHVHVRVFDLYTHGFLRFATCRAMEKAVIYVPLKCSRNVPRNLRNTIPGILRFLGTFRELFQKLTIFEKFKKYTKRVIE